MANSFSSLVHKQVFDEGVQDELRENTKIINQFADVRTDTGEYIYARKGTDIVPTRTSDSTYTTTDFSYDKDSIGLDKQATVAEVVPLMETVKQGFEIKGDRMNRYGYGLAKTLNQEFIISHAQASGTSVIDNEVLAGSASALTPITLSNSNPDEVSSTIIQVLQEANAFEKNPYLIVRPKDMKLFGQFLMGTGNNEMDRGLRAGTSIYTTALGFDLVVSNEVPYRQTLSLSGVMTANDTVTVAGIVATAKASAASAGEFTIGASAAATAANLAALFNNLSGATGSGHVAFSSANRAILATRNMKAVVSGDTVIFTANGRISGTESGTNASFGTERALLIAADAGSVVMRMPEGGYSSWVEPIVTATGGITGKQIGATRIYDSGVWSKTAPKIAITHVGV
jgi:hypothetical protein